MNTSNFQIENFQRNRANFVENCCLREPFSKQHQPQGHFADLGPRTNIWSNIKTFFVEGICFKVFSSTFAQNLCKKIEINAKIGV